MNYSIIEIKKAIKKAENQPYFDCHHLMDLHFALDKAVQNKRKCVKIREWKGLR